jgi:hypothetical protein
MLTIHIRSRFLCECKSRPFCEHPVSFDIDELLPVVHRYPARFAVLGGGGDLNPMILRAHREGVVSPEVKQKFRARALAILSKRAIGLGEFASEHPTGNRYAL